MNAQRIIWLASFPKSGNTWLRSFLAQYFMPQGKAPDINALREFTTGDVRIDFFERAAGRKPFVAADFDEWLKVRQKALHLIATSKPSHHFVKTHCRIDRIGPYFLIPPEVTAAALYLIRNPFDVAQSYSRHLSFGLDDTIARMLDPAGMNHTTANIFEVTGRWDGHIQSWTEAQGLAVHVMRYEDMIADTEKTFRALLGFLRAPVQDGKLRRAIRATSFDTLKREEATKGFIERPKGMEAFFAKGKVGSWREALSPDQVGRLREGFGPTIERYWPEMLAEVDAIAGRAGA
ncbi:MAG: sulfotransferase domain-containing protein [Pseudomonadota bacterium]